MKSFKLQAPNSREAPSYKPQVGFAAFENQYQRAQSQAQGMFKKGAGTASSPRLVDSTVFYGNEPSPALLAHFPQYTLSFSRQSNLEIAILDFFGVWCLEFGGL